MSQPSTPRPGRPHRPGPNPFRRRAHIQCPREDRSRPWSLDPGSTRGAVAGRAPAGRCRRLVRVRGRAVHGHGADLGGRLHLRVRACRCVRPPGAVGLAEPRLLLLRDPLGGRGGRTRFPCPRRAGTGGPPGGGILVVGRPLHEPARRCRPACTGCARNSPAAGLHRRGWCCCGDRRRAPCCPVPCVDNGGSGDLQFSRLVDPVSGCNRPQSRRPPCLPVDPRSRSASPS